MLSKVAIIGILILFINGILYFKTSFRNKTSFKIFTLYLLVMFIIQIASFIMLKQKSPNLFLSHFYFVLQFILLSFFYLKILESKTHQKIIKITIFFVLLIITIQYIITPKIFYTFFLGEIILTSIPILYLNIIYFMESLNKNKKYLYVNCGIFIYLLCSTLFFSAGNFMKELDESVNKIIWIVNAFIYVIFQVLVFIEWYKNFRIKNLSNEESVYRSK